MTVNPFPFSNYSPSLPPNYGVIPGYSGGILPNGDSTEKIDPAYSGAIYDAISGALVSPGVEEKDEDFIDPSRFDDIVVGVRYTPGQYGKKIDLAFGNIDLDDADDFFRYLGTDEGLADLTATILAAFVQAGTRSAAAVLAILLS